MNNTTIKGKNVILYLYDGTGKAYLPVGCLTTNGLKKTIDTKDGTVTKCDPSPDPVLNKKSYEATFEAVAIEDNDTRASYDKVSAIMDAMYENLQVVPWKEVTTLSDGTKQTKYGRGYLTSLDKTAPVEGEVTFSGTIAGSGEITDTDQAPTA